MGKHVESYYSHLIRTFLTHLARSLPQFHAPHIEADSSNNSSNRLISTPPLSPCLITSGTRRLDFWSPAFAFPCLRVFLATASVAGSTQILYSCGSLQTEWLSRGEEIPQFPVPWMGFLWGMLDTSSQLTQCDWAPVVQVADMQVRMHAQSCPVLRDPLGCSPPGSSVHGIFQTRIL